MNDILLIRNDVEFSGKHKGVFERSFSKKDLDEAAYILSIKIYRDRSRCLISFSMSTYLDKILKEFKVDQSKKEFLPVLQGVKLSKTQDPTIAENRKRMKSHSPCLSHRFYKVCYPVYQTYFVPHHEFGKRVK